MVIIQFLTKCIYRYLSEWKERDEYKIQKVIFLIVYASSFPTMNTIHLFK